MTPIDTIREFLHLLAGMLMWPVMLGLVILAAVTLFSIGTFVREGWERRKGVRHRLEAATERMRSSVEKPGDRAFDLRLEKVLQQEERGLWRSLTLPRLSVRVGPALGLMGTLIPMAYALAGLAEGNMPALASNMVTAFAATVIGLAISVIAYLIAAGRESWVRADTQELAFVAEDLLRAHQPSLSEG
jgi:biopolymer transport protein ExbB/TolQ